MEYENRDYEGIHFSALDRLHHPRLTASSQMSPSTPASALALPAPTVMATADSAAPPPLLSVTTGT
jgi:hypothetical protein